LLDCPALFDRPGNPYLDPLGHDWPDNGIRFGLLSRVAALLGQSASPLRSTGDQMSCISTTGKPRSPPPGCITKGRRQRRHRAQHRLSGLLAASHLPALGLPEHAWRFDGVEYHGQLSFLKAGLQLATLISTVSPTYAREIQDEAFGYALAPLLRHRKAMPARHSQRRRYALWNPATDPALPHPMPPTGWPPSARTNARCK
jgi:starch synthase